MTPPGRIVVKIGTHTLCGRTGVPDQALMAQIADEIAEHKRRGHEFLIVSSGAIGIGKGIMAIDDGVQDIAMRQALAALGQARLVRAWEEAFAPHKLPVAQMLLTHHSFTGRKAFLNLRNATAKLLELGAIPIINENDTVSIDEIDASFGDNDRLSAYVATKVGADLLILLSDVAGLHTRPPGVKGAQLVPVVERITPEVEEMAAFKPGTGQGRGGMQSKLDAARIATRGGSPVVIANGHEPQVLSRILAGEQLGTRFLAQGRERGKKQWLTIARAQGRVHVDDGAAEALSDGRHLLPAGVVAVEGPFPAQCVIEIVHEKAVIAKAVTAYSSKELERVQGLRSAEVKSVLGRSGAPNVTKKKNLVLLDKR